MDFKLNFEIQRQDYVDFNKHHFLKTKLKKTIFSGTIVLVILQIFFNMDNFDLIATLISCSVFIILYILIISRSLNNTKKIPRNDGSILGKKELFFSDDGIFYNNDNSSGNAKWNSILSIQDGLKAYYLYMDSNMAIIVPKRAFNNDKDKFDFENYVKNKINNA